MSRNILKVILLASMLLPLTIVAADDEVKTEVAISIQQDQDIWTGQQVTLNLDLKTTGFSFSDTYFNLPEVPGAFLMQTDTTTVKFTENIDGRTWQIIRYPLALYPQKAGQLEIPGIAVRFKTSAGFGSTAKSYEFQTKPLILTISSPPGVKDGDLVITTTDFELDYEWQPESGTALTGDAFTLTVKRRAADISAMLLPPLPVFQIEGLAAYPQAPEVSDKTNRGSLRGERVDSIIWVAEQSGSFDIPGIRFQWWDPRSRDLKQQIIPGLSLDIRPLPAEKERGASGFGQAGMDYLWLQVAMLAVLIVIFLRFRFRSKLSRQTVETEKSSFATVQKACKSNQSVHAHSAIHAWLAQLSPALLDDSSPITLGEFAQFCGDAQLGIELERLQVAVISSNNGWHGRELLRALQRIRRNIINLQTTQQKVYLAPLNP